LIQHQHELSEWIYKNVSHERISIMDVDALVCFYKHPDKPLVNIEYKNQGERIRPTQWFNLPRLEEDHNIPYLIIRTIGESVSIERLTTYCNTIQCAIVSRQDLKIMLEDYDKFAGIYKLAKTKQHEYFRASKQNS